MENIEVFGALLKKIKSIVPGYKPYSELKIVEDYLFEAYYNELDYDFANNYFLKNNDEIKQSSCSSIVKDGKLGKNNDWLYSNGAELVIHTPHANGRYATLGICSAVPGLTNDICKNKKSSDGFILAPFCMVDGINENGLSVTVNTVPNEEKGSNDSVGNGAYEINPRLLSRWILDYYTSVDDVKSNLNNDIKIKQKPGRTYEIHFLISDSTKSVCLEFVNGAFVYTDTNYMTNFHLAGTTLNADNSVYTPATKDDTHSATTTNNITQHGEGLERWNFIATNYSTMSLGLLLNSLLYSKMYSTHQTPSNPFWYTEYTDGNLTVDSDTTDFDSIVTQAGQLYNERSRNTEQTWHTTHSVIYDLSALTLNVIPQEGTNSYNFNIERQDGGDYNQLTNIPTLNGNVIKGNKTNVDLGISHIVNASAEETVKGYAVPKITIEQGLSLYNAFHAGKQCYIGNMQDTTLFSIIQADTDGDDMFIKLSYYDAMIVTYQITDNSVIINGTLYGQGYQGSDYINIADSIISLKSFAVNSDIDDIFNKSKKTKRKGFLWKSKN